MNPKMSSFIIALLMVSFIAYGFNLFLAKGAEEYSMDIDEDIQGASEYMNQLESLNEEAMELEDIPTTTVDSNLLDVLGNYFKIAWGALKSILSSVTTFTNMAGYLTVGLGLGPISVQLQTFIIAVIFVLVFVGFLIYQITKVPS